MEVIWEKNGARIVLYTGDLKADYHLEVWKWSDNCWCSIRQWCGRSLYTSVQLNEVINEAISVLVKRG